MIDDQQCKTNNHNNMTQIWQKNWQQMQSSCRKRFKWPSCKSAHCERRWPKQRAGMKNNQRIPPPTKSTTNNQNNIKQVYNIVSIRDVNTWRTLKWKEKETYNKVVDAPGNLSTKKRPKKEGRRWQKHSALRTSTVITKM